jgi:hypothetical protein
MRRFMVHLMAEVDFEDGDEASDKAVQNYQKHFSETVRKRPKGSRSGRSRVPGSRVSRSQKSRLSSSNPPISDVNNGLQARPADEARQHPRKRCPSRDRHMRSPRTEGGRQRLRAAGERDGPQGRPAPTVQLVRRVADLKPPRMAYSQTFRRAGFHEAASLREPIRFIGLQSLLPRVSPAEGTGGKDALGIVSRAALRRLGARLSHTRSATTRHN